MEKWLICSAWPYAHYVPHLGNMIGSILSADCAARFLRLKGYEVIYVSGSDEHGTPIEIAAIKMGVKPIELTDKLHEKLKNLFNQWNISFDNYSRTESQVHKDFVKSFYLKLYDNGYIFEDYMKLPFCPHCKIFLPDRFIRGTCPYCSFEDAKGDQCDKCGRLLTPTLLLDPRCAICGTKPTFKETKHWFFDLPKLEDKVKKYIEHNENLPDNARNMSLKMISDGLKPRSLTRDNKWGIPAPFPGAEDKTIYVWMEAVLGYISATIELFEKTGNKEGWRDYWFDKTVKSVYFIGKDNIPFHTIIFPALLIASEEGYILPWTVSSTEFLLFEGEKFSKSRRIGIWIDEALELLPVDYWRFFLFSTRPETKDANFKWSIFREVINSQLNDAIGNFIHRTLSLIYNRFNGEIPEGGELDEADVLFLESAKNIVNQYDKFMINFRLRLGLQKVVEYADLGNRYLNEKEPWRKDISLQSIKNTLNISFMFVRDLAIMLYPFIPSSVERLSSMINISIDDIRWKFIGKPIKGGHRINRPKPLFRKLSEKDIEDMKRKLEEIRSRTL